MVFKKRKAKKLLEKAEEAYKQGLISKDFYMELVSRYGGVSVKEVSRKEKSSKYLLEEYASRRKAKREGEARLGRKAGFRKIKLPHRPSRGRGEVLEEKPMETIESEEMLEGELKRGGEATVSPPSRGIKPKFKPVKARVKKPKLHRPSRGRIPKVSRRMLLIIPVIALLIGGGFYVYRFGFPSFNINLGGVGGGGGERDVTRFFMLDKVSSFTYIVNTTVATGSFTDIYKYTVTNDSLNGTECWKVNIKTYRSGTLISNIDIWVEKETCSCLRVKMTVAGKPVNVKVEQALALTGLGFPSSNITAEKIGKEKVTVSNRSIECVKYCIDLNDTQVYFWISDEYDVPVKWSSVTSTYTKEALLSPPQ